MKHDIDNPAIRSYLSAVEARLVQLPADQSEEILFGIREHIADALERGGQTPEEVLASLGSPDDVLGGMATQPPALHPMSAPQYPPAWQQPLPQPAARPPYQSSTLWVVATVILLPFGIFLAGVGYLFGLAGLWMGTRWKVWEKIMGTVLFPGGMLGALYATFLPLWNSPVAGSSDSAEAVAQNPLLPGMGLAASSAMLCVPIIVAVYLLVVGLRCGRKLSPATPSMRHN